MLRKVFIFTTVKYKGTFCSRDTVQLLAFVGQKQWKDIKGQFTRSTHTGKNTPSQTLIRDKDTIVFLDINQCWRSYFQRYRFFFFRCKLWDEPNGYSATLAGSGDIDASVNRPELLMDSEQKTVPTKPDQTAWSVKDLTQDTNWLGVQGRAPLQQSDNFHSS